MKKAHQGTPEPRALKEAKEVIQPTPPQVTIPPDLIEKMLFHFPRELVASIAVQLLKDDDDFARAAHRAIQLLIACDTAQLQTRKWRADCAEREAAIHGLPSILSFDKAIKLITGKPRADDAMKAYREFSRAELWRLWGTRLWIPLTGELLPPTKDEMTLTDSEWSAFVDKQKKVGIPSNQAADWQQQFAEYSKLKKSRAAKEKGSKGGRGNKKASDDSESS